MKAIVTVIGPDRVGIMAEVCTLLAGLGVNVLDLSQTVMDGVFTMVTLVDTATSDLTFDQVQESLAKGGEQLGLSIRIQRQDIFDAMHRI